MRRVRVPLLVVLAAVLSGCGAPVVYENPTTRQRVNCTAEALRLSNPDVPGDSTGKDVPRYDPLPPPLTRFDYERQCAGNLESQGFICISGC
jgi:hypothetical protein